ncbi:MAG: ketoacyl-ACP synthase III [Magnetococcales bacterium]|nr:ketoacyl-ACP synthase III [Magnetococcales bacterium]
MNTPTFHLQIRGVSLAVPAQGVAMADLGKEFGDNEVQRIIKATGITRVRVAPDGVCASDLCQHAAEKLLEALDFDRQQIGALIFASHSPDHPMPATSCILQHRLGLRNDLAAFDIPYGCSGFVYSLIQAGMLIHAGLAEHVLILAGDTMVRKVNPLDRALRMVLGDGGGAALVSRGDNPAVVRFGTDGSGAPSLTIPAGGFRQPHSPATAQVVINPEDGSGRSLDNLYMDGTAILRFALDRVPPLAEGLLAAAGWDKDELDYAFLHQANGFIIDYLRKKLKLPKEKVPIHLGDYGNLSPASIPLVLCKELHDKTAMPKKVLLAGFGVGFSWAGMATSLEGCRMLPIIEMA